ncbi:MAG: LysR family transcriptional regulator [Sphingomonadales bacterium]|jgi:DNA-binding transcriptional LysR family regulator
MMNWDDYRLFLSVARAQGLAAAVGETGLSAPSLSRRLRGFEEAVGQQLFIRQRDGYQLTAAAQELLDLLQPVEQQLQIIDQWRANFEQGATVKIACGGWTGFHLVSRIAPAFLQKENVTLSIITGTAHVDLLRREAHLAIRNKRPDVPSLIAQKLGQVEFAVFGSQTFVQNKPEVWDDRRYSECSWVISELNGPPTPSARWLLNQLHCAPQLIASDAQTLLAAVRSGQGLCVLPTFIGDDLPDMVRVGEPIAELAHSQWLIRHKDDLHVRAIQKVAAAIMSI